MPQSWQPSASLSNLRQRARVLRQIREFMFTRDVLELPTSALAKFGVTDPAVESIPVPTYGYLQSSPEYQLKRALAAGAPSCYSMAPAFRHGEAGRLHNPEFLLLEWYRLGWSEQELMREVAELVAGVLGPAPVQTQSYAELLGHDPVPLGNDAATLAAYADEDLQIVECIERLTAAGVNRLFVTDYPVRQAALAQVRSDTPAVAARFEFVVHGVELANGYLELLDATELRSRFERDQAQRATLGLNPMAYDERLLDAMAAGLPACAGVALGVDRLVMLACGTDQLREVIPFPVDLA